MREIKLNAKQGEELKLTNGDNCSLVIKIDGNAIIPDFVDALAYAVATHPRDMMVVSQNALHNTGVENAKVVFAKIRDDAFASVVVPKTASEPTVTVNDKKEDKKQ